MGSAFRPGDMLLPCKVVGCEVPRHLPSLLLLVLHDLTVERQPGVWGVEVADEVAHVFTKVWGSNTPWNFSLLGSSVQMHFFQSMIFPFTMGGDMLLYSPGGFLNVLLYLGFYQRCTVFGA